jgi:T5SS/PEP-CTERM-associated repeat protein/autotransporter-associated beta strand protein
MAGGRGTVGRRGMMGGLAACAAYAAVSAGAPDAAGDTWKSAANGMWGLNASWTDGSVPGTGDQVTFGLAGNYTASFDTAPVAIRDLFFLNGGTNVRLQTATLSGGPYTLNVTAAGAGMDLGVAGGATLTLGAATPITGVPLHLNVADDAFINVASTLNVTRGSHLTANDLFMVGASVNLNTSGTGTFVNTFIGDGDGTAMVTVSGIGASMTSSTAFDVGSGLTSSATGVLNIQGGATVNSATALNAVSRIGVNDLSSGSGTVNVSGAGSTWTTGRATIAEAGIGTLNISAGGHVDSQTATIGNKSTGVGTVNVSGPGSQWSMPSGGGLTGGLNGSGALSITNGAVVQDFQATVAHYSGSTGFVTVDAAQWIHSSSLIVGTDGFGTMNVTGGGIVQSGGGIVGNTIDATGIVTVDGSQWNSSGGLGVGEQGVGTLYILGGGQVRDTQGTIGYGSLEGHGTVTVDGAGSQWINSQDLWVAGDAFASLNITGGGLVQCANANIAVASIRGHSGTVFIDGAGSAWNIGGSLKMSATGGASAVIIKGGAVTVNGNVTDGGSGASTITLDGGTLDVTGHNIGGATPINVLNFRSGTLENVAQINNGAGLTKSGTGQLTLDGTNTYTGTTTISAGTMVFKTSYTSGFAVDIADGAAMQLATSLATPHNIVLKTGSINTHTSGRLDLCDNKLIVSGGDAAAITGLIKSGFNLGGTLWAGPGITTSLGGNGSSNFHALGVILNDLASVGQPSGPIYTSFGGQDVGVNDVLVKYTYFGDADLDGAVTTNDYFQIDNGFLGSRTGWINGDFDYDGAVTTNDYFLIDNAFLGQGAALVPASLASASALDGVAAVPEPASLGLFASAGAGLLLRRRPRPRGRGRGR